MGRSASVAELPGWARRLLEDAPVARLGLLDDDGAPRVLPVTFARGGRETRQRDRLQTQAVAGERLARVRWLRARPAAALTVDRYDDDWGRLAWVQVLGEVEIVDAGGGARRDRGTCGAL